MADEEKDESKLGTTAQRAKSLFQILAFAVTAGSAGLALGSSVTLVISQYIDPPKYERFWQLPDTDREQAFKDLKQTVTDLRRIQSITDGEAQALAKRSQDNVTYALSLLQSLPYVERRTGEEYGLTLPSFITPAYAQSGSQAAAQQDDLQRLVVYVLIGVVVAVLLLFVMLYMFTKDKSKKAFAEKTITSIVGFVFGLITGSMTGRLH